MADHICPTTISPVRRKGSISCTDRIIKAPHPLENVAASKIPYYTPQQTIPAGTAILHPDAEDKVDTLAKIFQPLVLRGLHLQNRILVSPMCQYSAIDGHLTDWHLAHLGGIMQRGPGLTVIEATAVTPEGRITPQDSGLWQDSQIEPLKRIVDFAHGQNQFIAIQLAHAGRKASTVAPWIDRKSAAPEEAGGWPDRVISASDIPYDEHTCVPRAMTLADIVSFKNSFMDAVHRALKAGVDAIEIHAAHGYLLHATLSAATNRLPEPYGGSLENRMRLLLELTEEVRATLPSSMPLLVRIPGNDWLDHKPELHGWTVDEAATLGLELSKLNVDLLDVSSGGLVAEQKIISGPSYQAPFSHAVKKACSGSKTQVGTVGMITTGKQAEKILEDGMADVIFVGRAFLKNTGLVWQWAEELGVEVRAANQIGWGFGQRPGGGVSKAIPVLKSRGE
ncbi:hypothetical protein B7463_g1461, partial [Scytalidium lignicola]